MRRWAPGDRSSSRPVCGHDRRGERQVRARDARAATPGRSRAPADRARSLSRPAGRPDHERSRGRVRRLHPHTSGTHVDVVGTSTGGSIAQQLAADHPETVRRLALLSTACRLGTTRPRPPAARRRTAAGRRTRRAISLAERSRAAGLAHAGTLPRVGRPRSGSSAIPRWPPTSQPPSRPKTASISPRARSRSRRRP